MEIFCPSVRKKNEIFSSLTLLSLNLFSTCATFKTYICPLNTLMYREGGGEGRGWWDDGGMRTGGVMTVFRINSLGMFWNDPPVLTLTHNTQNFFGSVFYLQNESNFEGFCLFVNVPSNVFNHWRPFSLLRRVLRKISWNKFNFQGKKNPKMTLGIFWQLTS